MARVLRRAHLASLTTQSHWPLSLKFSFFHRLFLLLLTSSAVPTFAEDVYDELKVAIERDDTVALQLMIKTEVDLNNLAYKVNFSRTMSTPIHLAVVKGNIDDVISVDVNPPVLSRQYTSRRRLMSLKTRGS
jgi:hypothetical protein